MDEQSLVTESSIKYLKKGFKLGIIITLIFIALSIIYIILNLNTPGGFEFVIIIPIISASAIVIVISTAIGGILDIVRKFEKK